MIINRTFVWARTQAHVTAAISALLLLLHMNLLVNDDRAKIA